ncbi:hypothetical protein DFH11DRAFT_1874013 [Phellopilus nigrolimitatus]|nr:hypothetical protein DFH11DRAFT_1874013 [Phellopilus nigrolimitatus]
MLPDLTFHLDHRNPVHAAGAAVLAVVLLQATRLLVRRFTSMSITVKWGREKLHVPLPARDAKLRSLRATIAEHTALPPTSFKLIHSGAVMKDDNAPISDYGIRAGSTITIIGGAGGAPAPLSHTTAVRSKKPTTEEGTIAVIHEHLSDVQARLVPELNLFLGLIGPAPPSPSPTSSAPAPSPAHAPPAQTQREETADPPPSRALPDIEMEYRRLGEELLQALLGLDVLALDGEWA